MALQWTPALSVGIAELDAQHRELFRRAARFLDGVEAGAPEELSGLLGFLHEYALTHFGLEESWMRDAHFPGYVRHKAEHDRFIGDLMLLAREAEARETTAFAALRVNGWLAAWLTEHVAVTDAELGRFLASWTA
jgi:hemerythrin